MLKPALYALILYLFAYLSCSVKALSQTTIPQELQEGRQFLSTSNDQNIDQVNDLPLTQIGTEYHNSIKLLQNRFRIDYEVEEITMVFFRDFGASPVVLVQPDGSKIYQTDAEGEYISWFFNSTYDMIRIKNPMPGPWQAVGQILPESQVMVISDLALKANPLPNIIFSGEILKQTAYLTNNNIPIDYAAFRDVIELSISLSSTNDHNFNNFGAEVEIIALFEDDGKGMDEMPLDGVFTGRFNLDITEGEWIPTFSVSTPMFTRDHVYPKITLLANPIQVDVELDVKGEGHHKLTIDTQSEYVDVSSLLIDGKVLFPNGDIQNFSLTNRSTEIREHLIANNEDGLYRVKLSVYGDTYNGREFILDVPEYSFISESTTELEPKTVAPAVEKDVINTYVNDSADKLNILPKKELAEIDKKMSTSTLVILIVGINLFILLIGGGLIWLFTTEKKPNFNIMKKFEKLEVEKGTDPVVADKKLSFIAKILKRKSKKNNI
jgi:uncharacterized protein (TIGR03503 family)